MYAKCTASKQSAVIPWWRASIAIEFGKVGKLIRSTEVEKNTHTKKQRYTQSDIQVFHISTNNLDFCGTDY